MRIHEMLPLHTSRFLRLRFLLFSKGASVKLTLDRIW